MTRFEGRYDERRGTGFSGVGRVYLRVDDKNEGEERWDTKDPEL